MEPASSQQPLRATALSQLIQSKASHSVSIRSTQYYATIYAQILQVVSFLQVSQQKSCVHFSYPHNCQMPRSSPTMV